MRLPAFFGFVRLFFENFLISPKDPSSIFLIFCNRTNVKESQRVPFRFFGTTRLLKILIFCFSKIFQSHQRIPLQFFWNFETMDVKKSQRVPLLQFSELRFFKMTNFCLQIRFSLVLSLYTKSF